jgi:ribosomal protein S18 acetylase RimI-like enzyme
MPNRNSNEPSQHTILPANRAHYDIIEDFLTQDLRIHRHLDWYRTLDWLGSQPFLIEMNNDRIEALLCAPLENNTTAWIRAFAVRKRRPLRNTWRVLLEETLQHLKENKVTKLAAIAMHPWFESLLSGCQFENRQDIVVLEWQGDLPSSEGINADVEIRMMQEGDLPQVMKIDHRAFPPLWQNSLGELSKAFKQKGISTVAMKNKEIVGYQISTTMTIYAHLARLAVLPEHQRQGIAYALVYDLLSRINQHGFWRVTVNTQSDNIASLKLYDRLDFKRTGEKIPVYELRL